MGAKPPKATSGRSHLMRHQCDPRPVDSQLIATLKRQQSLGLLRTCPGILGEVATLTGIEPVPPP
jgi:hypothetical protein